MKYQLLRPPLIMLKANFKNLPKQSSIQLSSWGYMGDDFSNNIVRFRHRFISAN